MVQNKRLPIFALLLLLASLVMGMGKANAEPNFEGLIEMETESFNALTDEIIVKIVIYGVDLSQDCFIIVRSSSGGPHVVTNARRVRITHTMECDFKRDDLAYFITIDPADWDDIVVSVPAGAIRTRNKTDGSNDGRTNLVAYTPLTVPYIPPASDTTPPTVTSFTGPDAVNNSDKFTVTATFSEAVRGLVRAILRSPMARLHV